MWPFIQALLSAVMGGGGAAAAGGGLGSSLGAALVGSGSQAGAGAALGSAAAGPAAAGPVGMGAAVAPSAAPAAVAPAAPTFGQQLGTAIGQQLRQPWTQMETDIGQLKKGQLPERFVKQQESGSTRARSYIPDTSTGLSSGRLSDFIGAIAQSNVDNKRKLPY